jgi:DNA-binding Xre family transcriptional regulator
MSIARAKGGLRNRPTRLHSILVQKKMKVTDLHWLICQHFKKEVSLSTLYNIAGGKRNEYTVSALLKICHVLDVSPNDIIDAHLIDLK